MKIVFIHGSGSYGGMWRYQTAHFPDSDAITLPGHPEGEIRTSVEGYTDWLKEYIVNKGYKDIVLCGQSLGGMIALMYALKYPEDIKGTIMIGGAAQWQLPGAIIWEREEAAKGNDRPWLRKLEILFEFTPPYFKYEVMGTMISMGPDIGLNDLQACAGFDIKDRLEEIRLPVLIIQGQWDPIFSVAVAEEMGKKLRNSKVVAIPRGTHFVFAEQPEVVNKAIADFVGSLS